MTSIPSFKSFCDLDTSKYESVENMGVFAKVDGVLQNMTRIGTLVQK